MKIVQTLLATALVAATGFAHAADPAAADSARAQYDAERARCMSGTTGQDQASCLRSAGAAYDSMRQGRLNDPNTSYQANALARCQGLPASDKTDCEARVAGEGAKSGSVKGGGDIKETVTIVPPPTR